jgi:pyruvate-formate lyase
MDRDERLRLLLAHRAAREATMANGAGEATGRTYLPVPDELLAAGSRAEGPGGFVECFRVMLCHSPVVVRPGELLVGDYYFLLPYEVVPLTPPVDPECGLLGAGPVPPSGHTAVNVARGLRLGWEGLRAHAEACRARFDEGSSEAGYLDATLSVIDAIRGRILDYGREAVRLASLPGTPADLAADYAAIAERCERLAAEPPRTFYDALQWYWLYATFERATSTGMGSMRLDQVLWPYYAADLAAGVLDDDGARLLLSALILKEPFFCTIGGQRPGGGDAVNRLSYLMIEAYDAVGGPSNLAVRCSRHADQGLIREAARILAKHGTGVPHIVNDEAVVPSLMRQGFPREQARDYVFAGCFWWCVPGKEYPSHDLAAVSGARALMRALESLRGCGALQFEDVWDAYRQRMAEAVHALRDAWDVCEAWGPAHYPEMVISLLLDGCLEHGLPANGGGAERSLLTVQYVGLANVADSLSALRRVVFDEQALGFDELMDALDADFAGDEALRQRLRAAPKFGNGEPVADAMAARVAEHFAQTLAPLRTSRGFPLRPALYSWHRHTPEGAALGATPDGRRAGAPLANGGNPAHGVAQAGPTAVLHAMAGLGSATATGCPTHLHLTERDATARATQVAALVQTALDLGVPHLIINNVSRGTLRAAIEHPEAYADLTIRVTGYSARFVHLDRVFQEEIAARNDF